MPRDFVKFNRPDYDGERVVPIPIACPLLIAVEAGAIATLDAATITQPESQIAAARKAIDRQLIGTYLSLALGYGTGLVDPVAPKVKVFGRFRDETGEDERWELAISIGQEKSVELNIADDDTIDGSLKFTTVDMARHVWDVGRFRHILVGVERALTASSGSTADAIVVGRLWG